MPVLPTGTVTLLFSDIEGSTKLLERLGSDEYSQALLDHRRIMREAFGAHGGVEISTEGDSFFVAFASAAGAIDAAAQAQGRLPAALRVRIGIHTGTPTVVQSDYIGMDVHRAARIAACGHGGQVLISAATVALVGTSGLRDLGEHRLKDLSAPERIYQLGSGDFAPLRSLYQSTLPVVPTSLVGRDAEIAAVVDLLATGGTRVVTLTGPGGSGKTRLALQSAAELSDRYPDGVWWVPLATIHEPELVLEEAARVLGASGPLALHIRDRAMLLVFDNFEQVTLAASDVAQLLAQCPKLAVLITSREPLRIRGENEFPVEPLASEDAVRLFVERARAVRPGLEADEDVVRLCERLDDLPLALELAAARVNVLTPAQIAERLDKSLAVLGRGARDLPERHQTLHATIAWSYELLNAEEARLFSALSVFEGGCTLASAEAVASAEVDVLQGLVEKSLLRGAGGRFEMLRTIQDFATESLGASGTAETLRQRHAEHYRGLVEDLGTRPRRLEERPVLERLDVEHDNIRATLRWCEHHDRAGMIRLAALLAGFWALRSHLGEGSRWMAIALGAHPDPDATRIRLLEGAALLARLQGDRASARVHAQEALELAKAQGDRVGAARALDTLGLVAVADKQMDEAVALMQQSLEILRSEEAPRDLALVLGHLAGSYWRRGDLERARAYYRDSTEVARRAGERRLVATNLSNLASLLSGASSSAEDRTRARAMLEESLEFLRQVGHVRETARALRSLGSIARASGDLDRAEAMFAESADIARRAGDVIGLGWSVVNRANVCRLAGHAERAARLVAEAEGIARDRQESALQAYVLMVRALSEQQDVSVRTRLLAESARTYPGVPDPFGDDRTVSAILDADEAAECRGALERARRELGEERFRQAWLGAAALAPAD